MLKTAGYILVGLMTSVIDDIVKEEKVLPEWEESVIYERCGIGTPREEKIKRRNAKWSGPVE